MSKEIKGTIVTGRRGILELVDDSWLNTDTIKIEGELDEEFTATACKDGFIGFSDGTLLNANVYNSDRWVFHILVKGSLFDRIESGSYDDDTDDIVYFNPGLKWYVFTQDFNFQIKKDY